MGLFTFVKAAGRMLGIGGHDAVQDESKAAPAPPMAEAIKAELERLGLPAGSIAVSIEGDKVKVTGDVPDQATREKIILASGNVAGVATVEEDIKAAAGGKAPTFYTVRKGDTLSAIAKTQYGAANKYMAIFEANKPMLKDADKIYPGQVLRIPTE